jgi:VanZ family protein
MFRRIARLSFIIGTLAVTWLSLAPHDAVPEISMWDKLQHATAYAVLTMCGTVGFVARRSRLMVGAGLIVLGFGLEAAQAAVPGRIASIADGIANVAGVALGFLTAWVGNRLAGTKEGRTR